MYRLPVELNVYHPAKQATCSPLAVPGASGFRPLPLSCLLHPAICCSYFLGFCHLSRPSSLHQASLTQAEQSWKQFLRPCNTQISFLFAFSHDNEVCVSSIVVVRKHWFNCSTRQICGLHRSCLLTRQQAPLGASIMPFTSLFSSTACNAEPFC